MSTNTHVVSRRGAAGILGLLGASAVGAALAPARIEIGAQPASAAVGADHAHRGVLIEAPRPERTRTMG